MGIEWPKFSESEINDLLVFIIILEVLWNHSPTMWETIKKKGKKAPKVSTSDLADIIAYLFFANFDRSTGSAQKGEQLFESKSCSTCHEPTFVSPGKMDLLSRFWNNLPEMLLETRQQGIAWPTFPEGEMSRLIGYLMSVKED